jgi:hypothetical protein
MKQAHTFVASLIKVEYFWIACWIVSSSVTLRSVRRTILGMLVAVSRRLVRGQSYEC